MTHPRDARRCKATSIGTLGLVALASLGVVQFFSPDYLTTSPFARLASAATLPSSSLATPTADAFGRSGNVRLLFALPGAPVEFPLSFTGSADALSYEWVRMGDSAATAPAQPLRASSPLAPATPGFYHLAVVRDGHRELLGAPTLAVMVPFEQKVSGSLNGYRIGTYLAELRGNVHDHPEGFVEVRPEDLALEVTKHLRIADFVSHEDQGDVWPKYVALNPRLLDKLELVFADLDHGRRPYLAVDIQSGFRAPAYNAGVRRAARDSRHQYGDAADVSVDADGDGQITMTDELLVMLAVERVEGAHPDLAGGMGLYISRHYRHPYVHIDARGRRTRWTG